MTRQKDKTTLATTVYQKLRADIIQGSFPAGSKLRIDQIAARYDVGSNAVREALSRLSSERLVDRHEQRGFAVPALALSDWRTLVDARCKLESLVLRESMERRDDAWEENIVVAFHRLSRFSSEREEQRASWDDAHRNFHRSLLANCASPWLMEFCDVLADQAARYVAVSNTYRTVPRDGQGEHEALMKVVLNGSQDDACELLVQHYRKTLKMIEDTFEQG